MNIENKKTALDDDSLLYQKRDDSFGKKDTSAMSKKEKARYFKDYYLKAVLAALAIIAVAGSVIYTIFFRQQQSYLGVAFIDEAYITETDAFNEHLRELYEITSENDYVDITNYNLEDYSSQIRFTTLVSASAIDIICCSEENFEKYSQMGYFMDLSEFLPEDLYGKIEDQIVEASEVKTDENGNITQTYPAAPYGIDISENTLYKEYGGAADRAFIGIVANCEHQENAIRFIEHLASFESEDTQ